MSPVTRRARPAGARHPIAIVAARTGLSTDVLRMWERRYEVVAPDRAPDGQRLYSDADVERLRLLRLATEAGRSIGQVARLPLAGLAKLVKEDIEARPAAGTPPDSRRTDVVASAALERARAFDGTGLELLLRRAAGLHGLLPFLEHIAPDVLRRLGDEWHEGRLTPAQEHLASAVLEQITGNALRELGRVTGPAIVIATPSGERHVLGAASAAVFAAAEGWNVVYLGADLPAEDIARAALDVDAQVVALSLVYAENRKHTLAQLRRLRAALRPSVRVIAGGSGAHAMERELSQAGLRVCDALSELRSELRVGT